MVKSGMGMGTVTVERLRVALARPGETGCMKVMQKEEAHASGLALLSQRLLSSFWLGRVFRARYLSSVFSVPRVAAALHFTI